MLCARRVKGAADFASELNGGLVGFGTGVGDEHLGGIAHGTRLAGGVDQQFAERASPGIVVQIGGMNERLGLAIDILLATWSPLHGRSREHTPARQ